ncbi:RNB domain-containing ribonuclease [Arcicella sp. LKC2W]|uniref:ribonuclease R family protein n=1 Tax=Arcicella sp. LKC2W TaxID=2984198 RepID=UPI002B201476|nr:RNB domain-containing ribonuclease [Arcicella sp. LKC2W]MEA5459679.1 RNB domain-containing ribonuclease [Arcicella sp. LKC2W]
MTELKPSKEQNFRSRIKAEILEFFQLNEDTAWSLNQVHKAFAIRDRKTKDLFGDLLTELQKDKKLIRQQDGHYLADTTTEFVEGRIDHVNVRFGFVIVDGREGDILINARDLNGAIDGDIVKVLVWAKKKKGSDRTEGEVIEILQRGRAELVGTIEIMPNYAFVVASSKKIFGDIFISKNDLKDAQHGDKVIVKITKWAEGERKMEGFVKEVLGKSGENNTEMHAILAEFGLPNHFPEQIEKAADAIPVKITANEIKKRRDFRKITTFTIDPVDAKDFDDALSFEFLENGNYEVGVHIADVTHYVTPESVLEQEAYLRATSVYLVDRVVPMLPEKLSNGLCSLRPNEDKLTFSAVFEITPNAQVVKEWFGRTVIHSDKRFSYEEAQEQLTENREKITEENNDDVHILTDNVALVDNIEDKTANNADNSIEQEPKKKGRKKKVEEVETPKPNTQNLTPDYKKELNILNQLAHKLRDERFAKGAVNFETVEVKFQLDENGKPLGIYQKIRVDSHKLIEEFMLLANKKVAEYVFNLKKSEPRNTMVYRTHDAPDPEKLKNFSTFAKRFGYTVDTDTTKISASFNELMHDVEGKPEQNILENLAVRTMSKAKYSTDPIGHFGLAFPFYSHFTSPIRRYPDMMAHRMLQHYLDGGEPLERASWEQRCKHSSEQEKMAAEAERSSIKYKQVEYMSLMDEGKVWDGIISGVTEFGIFVEITETASEGLVRMVDLKDDFYDYDRENYRIVGQRNGRVFTFGDKLQVKVKECNLARRSMDLILVGGEEKMRKSKSKDSRGRDSRYKSGDSRSSKGGKRPSSRDSDRRKKR